MRPEITIPSDRVYVERLYKCLGHIEGDTSHKARRLRFFIQDEFRRIRAKYNLNPRVDIEGIIEAEYNRCLEKPLYQNTKLDKYKIARFDLSEDLSIDKAARIIRGVKNGKE